VATLARARPATYVDPFLILGSCRTTWPVVTCVAPTVYEYSVVSSLRSVTEKNELQ
jgi:hypothetical protein